MTSIIAPSITVETADQYKAAIDRVRPFAQRVHIDISDGEFAPVFLLSVDDLWWPREWIVDIHAMVKRPAEYVERLIALGPHMITLHAENGEDMILPILEQIKKSGIKAGVAVLKTTVPSMIENAIKAADHVLVFSGDLGHYGGTASLMQLEKVRLIKAINPSVEIGWDGGVSLDNAFTLAQGGVNVLNVGGALSNTEDPAGVFAELTREINKQGVI
jgi:ribulose-phosphate 3-epimerase